MITVYHGGTQTVERPVCMFGRENLDFGRGFYVTPLLKQASDWAAATAKRRNSSALINVYSLDREAVIKEGKCRIFNAYDHEWLDFIVASRRGLNPAAPYDYIEGGVANERPCHRHDKPLYGRIDGLRYSSAQTCDAPAQQPNLPVKSGTY